jgi:methionyl-tRNA formyltransferase
MPSSGEGRRRVLLVGQGPTACSALEALLERFEVAGLVRSAAPSDPVLLLAGTTGVPVHPAGPPRLLGALVDAVKPDCVVVSSYDRILGPELLAKSRFVNVHYAPLPRYRGRASVNWALINGEPSTAVTVHTMEPGVDAGGVLFQQPVTIRAGDTVTGLYERLNAVQRRHLAEAVARHLDGDPGRAQDDAEASYGCTRLPEDGEIDWSAPVSAIDRLVRALGPPYPGAFTWLDGRRLLVHLAGPVQDAPRFEGRVPGRVVAVSTDRGHVDVLTGDGVLRLHQVEADGTGQVAAATLVRSVKTTLGLRTADLLRRIGELEARLAALEAATGNRAGGGAL